MNRFAISLLVVLLAFSPMGCGKRPSIESGSGTLHHVVRLPAEYPVLAEIIGVEMRPSPDHFRNNDLSDAEFVAELRTETMSLDGINSDDADIAALARSGSTVLHHLLDWKERFDALPVPAGLGAQFLKGFLAGAYAGGTGDVFSAVWISVVDLSNETAKQTAILNELQNYMVLSSKVDALQMMLPHVARKYASPPSDRHPIVVDIDEAWGGDGSHDWLRVYNSGSDDLENCTIQVLLKDGQGHSRKNVHFIRRWPAKSWRYARYEPGKELLPDRDVVGKTTVDEIQSAEISIWSPTFSTDLTYVYQGTERDNDIAEHCKDVTLTAKYHPFQSGFLWNTERGVEFKLEGIDALSNVHAKLTFHKDSESTTRSWDHDRWVRGETKTFRTLKGDLAFDPTHLDLELSFPRSNYQHKTTVTVKAEGVK